MLTRRFAGLTFVLLAAALGQQRDFAGAWHAKFNGAVFMMLKLQIGESISGTLSGGHIEVNRDGDIINASGGGAELPISNARLEDGKLSFDWNDSDDDTVKFSMKLTGDGGAELQFLSLPEGVKMKPIRLMRP